MLLLIQAIVSVFGVTVDFTDITGKLVAVVNAAFVVVIPRISNLIAIDNISEEERVDNSANKFSELLNVTILFAFPLSVGLFMISKNLIILFSGNAYVPATSSLKILALAIVPATLANFFASNIYY